jgi:hypothetical protein
LRKLSIKKMSVFFVNSTDWRMSPYTNLCFRRLSYLHLSFKNVALQEGVKQATGSSRLQLSL